MNSATIVLKTLSQVHRNYGKDSLPEDYDDCFEKHPIITGLALASLGSILLVGAMAL